MAKCTKRELMARLPCLPEPTKNSVPGSVISGFTTGTGQNRFVLIDATFQNPLDPKFVPGPKVDLNTKNASRRRIKDTVDADSDARSEISQVVIRRRRSCSTRRTSRAGVRRGIRHGRELRSARPPLPSFRNRDSHS